MSEEGITRVKLAPNNPPKGETDWEQVDAMTEEEINAAALSDPDAQPFTEEELSQFRRVLDAKAIRESLKLSQKEFASRFHLPLKTLQAWESGRFQPDQAAKTLLRVIAHNPEAAKRTLESGEKRL